MSKQACKTSCLNVLHCSEGQPAALICSIMHEGSDPLLVLPNLEILHVVYALFCTMNGATQFYTASCCSFSALIHPLCTGHVSAPRFRHVQS